MLALWSVVVAVLVVSAFCSLCEAALYAVPASHIESLVSKKSRAGRVLGALREKIDQPITAILTLNTIANTAGAAVAGAFAARVFGAEWLVTFSLSFTVGILLFSEVLPKTVGVVYCRLLSPLIAFPLRWLVWLFSPVIWICGLATRAITRANREAAVSPEEIVVMARIGRKSGSIRPEELEVIQNILAVRAKSVREIMTPRSVLFTLDAAMSVDEASRAESLYNYSRVPVFIDEPDEILGIVYRRDILSALASDNGANTIREYMKPVNFVLDSMRLDLLLEQFLERRQHLFVVLNEFNDLVGVVTLEDVLEEILGEEIVDEFDEVVDMRELARERRRDLTGRTKSSDTGTRRDSHDA